MTVLTIAILVVFALVLVVAAFFDRRRGREIARDPDRGAGRRRRGSREED